MDNFENANNTPDTENIVESSGKFMDRLPNWARELIEWVVVLAVAAVIAFFLNTFVLKLAVVSGQSMEPTLQHGDRLYVNKLFYTPERGDVVIVDAKNYAGNYGFNAKERFWVKRVVATAGDSLYIDFVAGDVYVNGEKIDEPYVLTDTNRYGAYIDRLFSEGNYGPDNPIVIKEGEVFVMGDNRNGSGDSRIVGPISVEDIEGHAVFRFWPLNKMTLLDYSFKNEK